MLASPRHPRASAKPLLISLLVILAAAVAIFLSRKPPPTPIVTTHPATAPTTTRPTTKPQPPYLPKTLYDILQHDLPKVAATKPFEIPLDLRDAAHYTLAGPLYFDRNRLDLWITRPNAPPTPTVLRNALDEQTHVLRDHVLYVHWQPDDSANWFPHLVVSTPTGPELIYPSGHRLPLPPHPYDFSHPLSVNDLLILPTPTGAVALRIENNKLTESPHTLPGLPQPNPQPGTRNSERGTNPQLGTGNWQLGTPSNVQLLLDYRGVLAFLPSTNTSPGSRGVSRFLDGKWTDLTPQSSNFPDKILHLLPLLDGTLLVITPTTPNHVELHLQTLDAAAAVDTPAVSKLVESLSDENAQTRQQAFDQLTRYGPSIFPTLEKLLEDQPPEAKIRLRQLLRARLKPTLGPATLINNELRLVSRLPDGSALFYTSAGISLPTPNDAPDIITPAWLACRPGQPVRLLPQSLTQDLNPDTANLLPAQNEWLALNTPNGPSKYLGNDLIPLLKPTHRHFSHFIGIDRRGRWIFTTPTPSGVVASATTSPATTPQSEIRNPKSATYLVIDPTLPDPTPRLPYWAIEIKDATVGWDQLDNPALRSGDTAFALAGPDWKPLDLKSDTFSNTPPPPKPALPTTAPTTTATTQLGTRNSELGTPLLTLPDGTQYFDATTQIISIKNNQKQTFPLPPEHFATMTPVLLHADSRLFLFNQPGKCVRLSITPDSADPLTIDAVFSRNIPSVDKPLRIWRDPAGRICYAPDEQQLILFFPNGRIPSDIAQKMPASQLDDQRD